MRQMPRMTLYSAECTESPPYFSFTFTSGKMLQTTGDLLFLRRLMAVTTAGLLEQSSGLQTFSCLSSNSALLQGLRKSSGETRLLPRMRDRPLIVCCSCSLVANCRHQRGKPLKHRSLEWPHRWELIIVPSELVCYAKLIPTKGNPDEPLLSSQLDQQLTDAMSMMLSCAVLSNVAFNNVNLIKFAIPMLSFLIEESTRYGHFMQPQQSARLQASIMVRGLA